MIIINSVITKPVILDIPPPPPSFTSDFSLLHDGINEYSNVGNVGIFEFQPTDAYSISVWFKWDGTSGYIASRQLGSGTRRGWAMLISGSGVVQIDLIDDKNTGARKSRNHNLALNTGQWYNLIFTMDGTNTIAGMRIFIDGVESANYLTGFNGTLVTMSVTTPLHLGALAGVCTWGGNLDDLSIWNKQLTGTEITDIPQSGAPADLLQHSAVANRIGDWGFGDSSAFGTDWVMTDRSTNSNIATTVNMEVGDRVADVSS